MDPLYRTFIDLMSAEAAGLEKAIHGLEDEFEDQTETKEEAMGSDAAAALTDTLACLATARVKAAAALALIKNARVQCKMMSQAVDEAERRAEREYKGYDDDGDGGGA